MRKLIRKVALLAALALATPAWAQSAGTTKEDAKDTATEKKAQAKKKARKAKPGGETAGDKMKDAQDTATEKKAQAKKKVRKAGADAKAGAKSGEQKAAGAMDAPRPGDTGQTGTGRSGSGHAGHGHSGMEPAGAGTK